MHSKKRTKTPLPMKNVYGKNILVTGATSGIGRACAIAFAKAGCTVTGLAIDAEEKETSFAGGGKIRYVQADVTDDLSVADAMNSVGDVDVAILCAGFGLAGFAEEMPLDLARKQMEVNYFGVLRICSYILPKMRKRRHGLLVVISSIGGRIALPMQGHYSSSKYALEAFVESVRMEMRPFGVKATLIEPGDLNTGFTGNRLANMPEDSPYSYIADSCLAKIEHDERNGKSPEAVAEIVVKLVGKTDPPVRTAVGISFKMLMFLRRFIPDRAVETIVRNIYLSGK